MKNNWRYGILREEIKIKGVVIMTVKLIEKTKDGEKSRNVEIEKMNVFQTAKVAKGVSEAIKFVNQSDKLQNVFKQFNTVRAEVVKDAEAYYAEQKKNKVKESEIEEYDVGTETLRRTGALVWNDLLGVVSDLLYEIPDTIVDIVANASHIDKELLGKQDLETFLDVFDQAVEANDIEALVTRIKKLGNTFKKVAPMFSNQTNQETAANQQ